LCLILDSHLLLKNGWNSLSESLKSLPIGCLYGTAFHCLGWI
jgi:hypothetical protein